MNCQKCSARSRHQRGVVLISVLIFLLLLMTFVRMSMHSAIVNEQKAGADLDQTIAREMSYLALQDAVHDLRAEDFEGTFCGAGSCKGAARVIAAGKTTTKKLSPSEQMSFATEFMAKTAKVTGEGGLFNSETQKQCKSGADVQPLWHCVNWGQFFSNTSNNFYDPKYPSTEYGTYTGAVLPYKAGIVPPPRYIIEIFPGTLLGLTKGFVARVTAIGFGRQANDGAGVGVTGVTNVMQQAVYVLE